MAGGHTSAAAEEWLAGQAMSMCLTPTSAHIDTMKCGLLVGVEGGIKTGAGPEERPSSHAYPPSND